LTASLSRDDCRYSFIDLQERLLDPARLAKAAIETALPYIAELGKAAAKSTATAASKSAWEWIKGKLTSAAGKEAVTDLERAPGDADNRKAAEAALSKLLKTDPGAVKELATLLEKAGSTSRMIRRLLLALVTFAVALAAINGIYNWSSQVAWWLCVLIAGAALARVNNLPQEWANRPGHHRWSEITWMFWGIVFSLAIITAVEAYLAYFYYCSADYADTLMYRACAAAYGAFPARSVDHAYGPGERQIVDVINRLNEHAHVIEMFIVPVLLVITALISELLHYTRPQSAATSTLQPSRLHNVFRWIRRQLEFAFQKAVPFAAGALLALSFFAFGSVVAGNDESYRSTVAMLNANSEMRGSIRNLPAAIAERTRQIEALTVLLRDYDANSAERAEWRKQLQMMINDLRWLDAELKKARELRASPPDLAPYEMITVVGTDEPDEFRRLPKVDASKINRTMRRYQPPVIRGPVEPSGIESRYEDTISVIDDYNNNRLPRYQTAKYLLTDAVFKAADTSLPEESGITIIAADVIVRAGARNHENGAFPEVVATDRRLVDARYHVVCLNLVLEFNRWMNTAEGQDALRRIISENVLSPAGFVPVQAYLTKVRTAFGDVSPEQISMFDRELNNHTGWQDRVGTLATERQRVVPGEFNQSIRQAIRGVLGRACAAHTPSERLAMILLELG
jgi:hypothetical protein